MALAVQDAAPQRPFVGREAELEVLTHALDLNAHGHGSLVLVRGEPGIGKTTLLASALARVDPTAMGPVLRATADAMDRRRPYGLLLDALASGDADVRERVAAITERLREVAAVDFARADVTAGEQVLDLIEFLAARGPVTLVLEDLQWADPGSLTVLTRLCSTMHQQPLVVVGSTRPLPLRPELTHLVSEAEARHVVTTIELGPLTPESCADLTEALTRARADSSLLRQMAVAGGNPLFLIELLGVIQRDGSLRVAADGTASLTSAPTRTPSLALMIMNHLGSLSTAARDLLVLASVLGARFPIADLRLIAGQPVTELRPALTELMAAGVLGEEGESTLTFRHGLIQEVLVADVPATIRGELHHEMATRLDAAGAPPLSVAEHLLRAPGSLELVPWTLELAERVRTTSPDTAVELWRRVMESSPPTHDAHIQAVSGIARTIMVGGRTVEAAEIARAVLAGGTPAELESGLRATLSHALLFGGNYAGAQDEADRAARGSRLTPSERADHLAFAGWPRLLMGEPKEALSRAQEAQVAAEASGNTSARIFAQVLRGHVAGSRGDLDEALSLLLEAVQLADSEQTVAAIEAFPHQIAATLLADLDRVPESLALFERGRRLAERLGYLPGVFSAFYLGSRARALTGPLSDVEADLEARDSLRGRLDLQMEATTLGTRAWVALHRDGPDAAEPWVRRLGDVDAVSGIVRGVAWVHGPASGHAQAIGDTQKAFEILWRGWERCIAREVLMDCVQMSVQLSALALEVGETERAAQVERVVTGVAGDNAWQPPPGSSAGSSVTTAGRSSRAPSSSRPLLAGWRTPAQRSSPPPHWRVTARSRRPLPWPRTHCGPTATWVRATPSRRLGLGSRLRASTSRATGSPPARPPAGAPSPGRRRRSPDRWPRDCRTPRWPRSCSSPGGPSRAMCHTSSPSWACAPAPSSSSLSPGAPTNSTSAPMRSSHPWNGVAPAPPSTLTVPAGGLEWSSVIWMSTPHGDTSAVPASSVGSLIFARAKLGEASFTRPVDRRW